MTRSRSAVIVIDLQRQFVEPGGVLSVDGATEVVERIAGFMTEAREAHIPLIHTAYRRRHGVPAGATTARLGLPQAHVPPHSDLLADPRLRHSSDIVVEKPRQSAFYATDLALLLRSFDVERVVLTGLTTNTCVLATAFDAAARDFEVVVVQDLTWARPVEAQGRVVMTAEETHRAALNFIAYGLGAVCGSGECADSLAGR